jgi:hypothetical protein
MSALPAARLQAVWAGLELGAAAEVRQLGTAEMELRIAAEVAADHRVWKVTTHWEQQATVVPAW